MAVSVQTGGYVICVRKDDCTAKEKYKLQAVKEMVQEYEDEHCDMYE